MPYFILREADAKGPLCGTSAAAYPTHLGLGWAMGWGTFAAFSSALRSFRFIRAIASPSSFTRKFGPGFVKWYPRSHEPCLQITWNSHALN